MRLLCAGNGSFTRKLNRLLTHRHTGAFLSELAQHCNQVVFMQIASRRSVSGRSVNDYVLDRDGTTPVAVEISGATRLRKFLSYIKAIPFVVRHVRNADYMYVFVPGVLPALVAACAVVLRKPYGVYLRGERWVNSKGVRWMLARSDFVCANGGVLAEKARLLCDDVDVTVPMLDLTLQDCTTDRVFRHQPPWNILYVGRIETRKGVRELVEAAHILKDRGVCFSLNLVGDGTELEKIKASAPEYVRCLGLISDRQDLFSIYRGSDLFVFPSHDEGFPRVLYEAMAFEMPIVTTFVGSIPSLMKANVNCLEVSVGSAAELAFTMESALNAVELRRQLAQKGSKTMRQLLVMNDGNSHAQQVWTRAARYAKGT